MITEVKTKDAIALQALTHKVESNQVLWLNFREVNGNIYPFLADDYEVSADGKVDPILTWVETENPKSKYYATASSNAGLLQRKAFPKKEYKGIVKLVDTSNGVNYEYVDTLVHDGRGMEVTIKGIEYTRMNIYSIPEDKLNFGQNGISLVNFKDLTHWEPSYATSSQTRKGEIVAKRKDQSFSEYFNQIGFDTKAFEEVSGGRVRIKDINKMSKRVKQTASSSRPRNFFKDFELMEVNDVPFASIDNKAEIAQHLVFKQENTNIPADILIIPGFFVKQEIESVMTSFGDNSIDVDNKSVTVVKDAVDGSHMIDLKFAKEHGLADEYGELRAGEQIRWGQAIKGLFIIVPGLRDMLSVDMVLAEGGIKGNPIGGFENGNMDFAVLNRAREDELSPSINLSRQVLSHIQNDKLIDGLKEDTQELIEKVLDFDDASIRSFLNIKEYDSENEEVNVDQLTTRLYSTGKESFKKSHTMRRKLVDLLNSSLQRFSNGASLYLKDAAFKHMAVDPYAIIQYLREGVIGVDLTKETELIGIAPKHAVSSQLVEKDDEVMFQLNKDKGFAFRFPFLHEKEGRILNKDKHFFLDESTELFYERMAVNGHMQGLIFYSLWDMEPEGQSGADFDGDQTGWTTNEHVVNNIQEQPLFLDYSLVDGKIVSGCPFTGSDRDLTELLTPKELELIEEHDIRIEGGGISAPAELSDSDIWINTVGKLGAYLSRETLESNDIGRFTNISMTISHIINELELSLNEYKDIDSLKEVTKSIEKEIEGYVRLNLFLTVAIRWEVDKAKHGGAYFGKMPFLNALIDSVELNDIVELEKNYNLSLQRLIYGQKIV